MADLRDKKKHFTLEEDDTISETYTHPKHKDYVGKYNCNGFKCNCSWYANKFMCRHLIYIRMKKSSPIFEKSMFHKSHVKPTAWDPSENEMLEISVGANEEDEDQQTMPGSPGMESLIDEMMKQRT